MAQTNQTQESFLEALDSLNTSTNAAYDMAEQASSFLDIVINRIDSLGNMPLSDNEDESDFYSMQIDDISTQLKGIRTILESAITQMMSVSYDKKQIIEYAYKLRAKEPQSI